MNNKLKILFSLFFLFFFQYNLFSQTPVSGVINKYTKVNSILSKSDTLIVADASQFSNGDTVLIMQMKGASVRTTTLNNEELFGRVDLGTVNNTGKYEIIIAKKILIAENKVILRNPLAKLYDTNKSVQLIKVPSVSSATVTSTLTCDPWDGQKGGVVAIMVADTLVLNANIDVSGKGFRGAEPVLSANGYCASEDSLLFRSYFFDEAFDGAGRKGEGISENNASYAKGLGRWSNAGGGGNGRFAGGGGGGNAGGGGLGGAEDSIICNTPEYIGEIRPLPYNDTLPWLGIGGRGGQGLTSPNLFTDSTIFLGGGGGSGIYTSSIVGSSGGNGGGIVIILSNYIKPNGFGIIADGGSVTSIATASGGGGGGGGVIVFDIEKVQSDIILSVKGGKGGNTQGVNLSGPGGGGGGGIVLNGLPIFDSKFKAQIDGGQSGIVTDNATAGTFSSTDGNFGTTRNNYAVPLTGFLFNSILENQRICIGDVPQMLNGSSPKGGDGTYVYEWQKRTMSTGWSIIADSLRRDLQPPALFDTTFYRRIVSSAGVIDTSIAIGIYIHKKIQGNNIWGVDTICIDNSADTLLGTTVKIGGDGSGIYSYLWQSSFDNGTWNTINAVNDTVCWGGIITDTTYYRRKVSSGACFSYSDTVEIVGLPRIINNTLLDNQEICYAQIPELILGVVPANGLGVGFYQYSWQKSSDGINWNVIPDSTRKDFAPSNLIETTYYRRKVVSGDCEDISEPHKINVLPLIGSNTITNESVIYTCYNIPSVLLVGSNPTGGDLIYRYQWQISNDAINWIDIAENSNNRDFQPLAQTERKYYRRIVQSGINDCCVNTSNYVTVNILSLPIGLIADLDTTICSAQQINLDFTINSGNNPFTLYYNDGYSPFVRNSITATNTVIPVNPVSLVTSKQYAYSIDSIKDAFGCLATELTGEAKVLVYGWPVPDPGFDTEVCDTTTVLNATPTLGSGIWSQTDGPGIVTFEDELLYNSTIHVDVSGLYSLQWKETNWQCSDSVNVEILLYRAASVYAGLDSTLHYEIDYVLYGSVYYPDTIKENETTLKWDIISGPGVLINDLDSIATLTGLDGHYKEEIELIFKVLKPGCPVMSDTVVLTLKDLLLPTGFSPNGDGINDFFVIKGSQNSVSSELIIFNKWGAEVYRQKNYGQGEYWDGKNMKGNMLPEDTYFYIFNYTDFDNKTHSAKGFVVLKGQGNE